MTASPTILIVDDEPTGREVLGALLHNQNYRLFFASNGIDALATADIVNPDLILLDVMMHGMDGFEVCRRLRANTLLAEVPIILITALDDRESRLQGIKAGADDFITKPFDRIELRMRVQMITRLNRYRRLLAERSRLSWVVEYSEDGYVILDDQDFIQYANSQARLYLGLDDRPLPEQLTFYQIVSSVYQCEPAVVWDQWPSLNKEIAGAQRYLVRPESATAQTMWLQADLFDQDDSETRMVRLRDVTSELQKQRDTWTFHSSILHKLRTPLASLVTSTGLIASQPAIQNDDLTKQMTDIALRAIDRLSEQINEISWYVQATKCNSSQDHFPVAEIVTLTNEIADLLAMENVSITVLPAAAAMTLVLARKSIELILLELLGNAKKFHPQHTPSVEITVASATEDAVIIKIGDDGVTLSPQQLLHAWVPYYQGEKYFTGEVGGMGLGLSMVANQIWSVGGSCGISNQEEGAGVVVSLHVPCVAIQEQTTSG